MAEALTNQAYEYLYRKIVSCEYLPGQELNEKQLLEETSFGRTPLREALLMLQAENLIDIFPRKGMRITPFTEKSIDDLYQTRKLIEPTVCRKYISMYSKSRLLEYLKQFEKAAAGPDYDEFQIDTSFHSYLVDITGNEILINLYQSVMIQLNIADDYFKAAEQARESQKQRDDMEKESYSLKHDLVTMQMKLENLERKLQEAEQKQKQAEEELLKIKAVRTASAASAHGNNQNFFSGNNGHR